MKNGNSMRFPRTCALVLAGFTSLFALGQAPVSQLPEGPNRDTVQRICSSCHSVQMFVGRGMTREQWSGVVSNMIGRGAKISDEEFDQIVEYLGKTLPPAKQGGGGPATAKAAPARKKSLIDQVGADDKQVVDEEAAARGKTVYIAQCITCHGTRARGGEHGADLVRSVLVLHDRYGSTIGPYLAKGHPAGKPVTLTQNQVVDLSHFLQQQVGEMFRTSVPPDGGMLFVWPVARPSPMWMENTLVPLDMVFINADGTIRHIAENTVPQSLATVDSGGPVLATLELAGGTTARLNIIVGDKVLQRIFGNAG